MRIALTGMTGFIGRTATTALHSAGHEVTGLVRPQRASAVEDLGATIVTGTMGDQGTFDELLDGAQVLVHNAVDWAAVKADALDDHLDVNLCGGITLLEAAAERGCRLVLVSSVAVHHHMLQHWAGRVDHMHPSRTGSRYGALKVALEAHCWAMHAQHDLPVSILRPAAVYGIDPRRERSIGWPMIEALLTGRKWTRSGGGKFVHVDDVAACICAGAEAARPCVRIHHLADCYARWSDWVAMARRQMGIMEPVEHDAPTAPTNMFEIESVREDLSVSLNRGHAGIAAHIAEMFGLQRGAP